MKQYSFTLGLWDVLDSIALLSAIFGLYGMGIQFPNSLLVVIFSCGFLLLIELGRSYHLPNEANVPIIFFLLYKAYIFLQWWIAFFYLGIFPIDNVLGMTILSMTFAVILAGYAVFTYIVHTKVRPEKIRGTVFIIASALACGLIVGSSVLPDVIPFQVLSIFGMGVALTKLMFGK